MAEYEVLAAVSVPLLGRDVEPGEVVTVDDDQLMPADYFRRVEKPKPARADKTTVQAKE